MSNQHQIENKNYAPLKGYEDFIDRILSACKQYGIDVTSLPMDHIAYQTSTKEEYNELKKLLSSTHKLIEEVVVSTRSISIFNLNEPLHHKQYLVDAFELIAPSEKQVCLPGLEHLEFAIRGEFESFIAQYPNVPWDTSAMKRKQFPLIKVIIDDHTQVKFRHDSVIKPGA